jgi:electron transfer flavoprotein alpha subunit
VVRPAEATLDVEPAENGEIVVWAADLVRTCGRTTSAAVNRIAHACSRFATSRPQRSRAFDPAEAAQRVRELLVERPPTATSREKPDRLGEEPGNSYDCWSVVELVEGRIARVSLELLGKSRELAGKLGGRVVALVLGHDLDGEARDAIRHGAEAVVVVDDERLRDYQPELWADALCQVLQRERPHALLIPATSRGRDYGPRAAGELELGMTGDCVDLGIDRGGRLIQHKPAYGGNIVSVIMGATTPQLATVRPRMFEPLEPDDSAAGEIRSFALEGSAQARSRLVEHYPTERAFDLDEADTVIAVGTGVGPDGVEEIQRVAGELGAAVGGDRGACEAGLLPRSRQLGLLGRGVAPRLYVAVETEGDFEHAVASVKAGVILVFRGSGGPVTGTADVAVAGDWRETLPEFIRAYAEG